MQSLTGKSELYSRVLDVSRTSRRGNSPTSQRGNSPPSTIARPLTSMSKPSNKDDSKNLVILSGTFDPKSDRSAFSTKPSTAMAKTRTKFKTIEDDDKTGLNDPQVKHYIISR